MATIADEQTYTYVRPSALTFADGHADLMLATSGGLTARGPAAHPVFFDGYLRHQEQSAAALLAIAKVARTRFYTPPGMLAAILRAADPVVTSNGDRLRFESFSACCGVYARYDALPGSLDGRVIDTGTTNVDFNPPMRDALARVGGLEPLHLQVGEDVVVRTLDAEVTEKKVPLPERWLKGLAEVQLASATVAPAFEVAASEARRFIRGLPTSGSRKPVWVVPAGRGLRITTRPTPDGVSLSGLNRLKPLEPLLRFAKSMRAYAAPHDPHGATGVWELELDDARLVVTLSPESSRGFSGEGGGALGSRRRAFGRRRRPGVGTAGFRTAHRCRPPRRGGRPAGRSRRAGPGTARRSRTGRLRRGGGHLFPPRTALRLRTADRHAPPLEGRDATGGRRCHPDRRRRGIRPQRRLGTRCTNDRRGRPMHVPLVRQAQRQPGSVQARSGGRSSQATFVTDLADVVEVLETGGRQQVTSLLLGLTDQQRKVLGPKFRRWLTHGSTVRVPRDRESLAVVATAGGVRQAKLFATHGWGLTDEFVEDAVHILAERSPAWLPGFVESVLDEEGSRNWRMARGIVRAGIVPPPAHPQYYRGTVRGVPDYNAKDRRPVIDQLDLDPGLIGDHLISMLSTEATGRLLAYHDNYVESTHAHLPNLTPFPAGTWRVTLLVLSQEGRLDRGLLLDVVLAAPMRDWAAADLGWYARMLDALGPSIDEVVARQATYARLLTVEHGPSVKVAQREIGRILGDKRFEPALVIDASSATLGRSDKASVAAQLRLLEKLHKAHPDLPVVGTTRIAAEHPRADIREQTAKILKRLGEAPGEREPGAPFAVPAPEPRPISHAVEPVGSADELAEVLLALIEDIDPIEMERAIDGLLRLADDRPRTADLVLARAAQGEYFYDDPRIAPAVLSRAWLTPRRRLHDGEWPIVLGHTVLPANAASPETLVGALGRRLTGVAHAVRTGPHLSVALPSRADGSLGADTLSKRLSAGHPSLSWRSLCSAYRPGNATVW
jgi:hypothetical protein